MSLEGRVREVVANFGVTGTVNPDAAFFSPVKRRLPLSRGVSSVFDDDMERADVGVLALDERVPTMNAGRVAADRVMDLADALDDIVDRTDAEDWTEETDLAEAVDRALAVERTDDTEEGAIDFVMEEILSFLTALFVGVASTRSLF